MRTRGKKQKVCTNNTHIQAQSIAQRQTALNKRRPDYFGISVCVIVRTGLAFSVWMDMCMWVCMCAEYGWDIFQRKREKQKNWNYRLSKATQRHIYISHIHDIIVYDGCVILAMAHALISAWETTKGRKSYEVRKKRNVGSEDFFFHVHFNYYRDGCIKHDFLFTQTAFIYASKMCTHRWESLIWNTRSTKKKRREHHTHKKSLSHWNYSLEFTVRGTKRYTGIVKIVE